MASTVDLALTWLDTVPLPKKQVECLGMSDLNPANIIWDGQVCRLVDHVEHLARRISALYEPSQLFDSLCLPSTIRARIDAYRPLFAAF